METELPSIDLAKYILPDELFRYFRLCNVEELSGELHFYLDELNILPDAYVGVDMESKGFHQESVIKDFPLRDKSLYLHVRRRRWLNKSTGKVVSRDWHLVAEGTHYTQGFASFLKEFVRYLPDSVEFP
jgi:hypothetical protein